MFQVGKSYRSNDGEFKFRVKNIRGNEVTITYGNNKSAVVGAGELQLCKPVEDRDFSKTISEDVTDYANTEPGNKEQQGTPIQLPPKFKRKKPLIKGIKRDSLRESLGFPVEVAILNEDEVVEYDSKDKIARYYVCDEEVSICRCTMTDWKLSSDEVCSFLEELADGYNE